jgi:hypothetical protein
MAAQRCAACFSTNLAVQHGVLICGDCGEQAQARPQAAHAGAPVSHPCDEPCALHVRAQQASQALLLSRASREGN